MSLTLQRELREKSGEEKSIYHLIIHSRMSGKQQVENASLLFIAFRFIFGSNAVVGKVSFSLSHFLSLVFMSFLHEK